MSINSAQDSLANLQFFTAYIWTSLLQCIKQQSNVSCASAFTLTPSWHSRSMWREYIAARCFLSSPSSVASVDDSVRTVWRQRENAIVHALISNRVDYCNSILHRVAVVHLHPFQTGLCWTSLHGWLSESRSLTALCQLFVTTFTGFLLTSESSSNYVCSCSNVNIRWHHHTWHQCASSCRPTHVVISYVQQLVIDHLIPRTWTASCGPQLCHVWPHALQLSAAATEVCFIDTAAVLWPTQNCTVFR